MIAKGITNKGIIRLNNEDSFFLCNSEIYDLPNLYIVADGMGGHNAGEIASFMSIQFFLEYIKNNRLYDKTLNDYIVSAIKYSNKRVYKEADLNDDYDGMGTTFTCCIVENNKVINFHLGDSRVYLINDDSINQITTDHNYINEMLIRGKITQEEIKNHSNKNMITRALGTENSIEVDVIEVLVNKGDKILLCSDGLTNMLDNNEICNIVKEGHNLDDMSKRLIDKANDNGGIDNITIIIIEI